MTNSIDGDNARVKFPRYEILIYSVSTDSVERPKRDIARATLDRHGNVISVQVLQEFYVQMTRGNRRNPLTHSDATILMTAWSRFDIVDNTMQVLQEPLDIADGFKFSLWDSLIVAAAISAGCDILFTEDMSHGQAVRGLTIRNPFVWLPLGTLSVLLKRLIILQKFNLNFSFGSPLQA